MFAGNNGLYAANRTDKDDIWTEGGRSIGLLRWYVPGSGASI